MTQQRRYLFIQILVVLVCLGTTNLLLCQAIPRNDDADQISKLLLALSEQSKPPADVLDPTLAPNDRDRSLKHFGVAPYKLNIQMTASPAITGDMASAKIRVYYRSESGDALETSATARFIKRNGKWYFTNFDFLAVPPVLVLVIALGTLVGIGYAAVVLVLRKRMVQSRLSRGKFIQMFIPVFWPSLFRKTR